MSPRSWGDDDASREWMRNSAKRHYDRRRRKSMARAVSGLQRELERYKATMEAAQSALRRMKDDGVIREETFNEESAFLAGEYDWAEECLSHVQMVSQQFPEGIGE